MGNATSDAVVRLRAREILRESGRTLWYLRAILAGLLVLFVLLTVAMYYMGDPVETVKRTPSPMGETVVLLRDHGADHRVWRRGPYVNVRPDRCDIAWA